MVFDDEAASCCEEQQAKKSETCDDLWGCFYLKKTDNLHDFVEGQNQFYHAATRNAFGGVRKRKPKEINKEKDIIGGKKKLEIKRIEEIPDSPPPPQQQ